LKQSYFYIFILWLALGLQACSMVGQDSVMVPSYVCVPSYTFVTDSNTQGAASQAFNDMWISNSGELLGGIGIPSLLPVQSIGPTEVRVDAGISITGQNDKRRAYPLMATHTEVRNLEATKIDTIRPVFSYLPNADFRFIEDYDRISRVFTINPSYYKTGDTILLVNDNRAWKQGNNCGKIEMAADHQLLQLITDDYTLIGQGSPAYIEIDFKSNINMDIGYYYIDPITGNSSSANSVIQLFPTSTWKKIYIELTDEVSSRTVGTTYIIYIALYNTDNVVPDVYIDNVKLIGLKG
jgi:hypothetical protein